MDLTGSLALSAALQEARLAGMPLVALESTVITHGLPYPENIQLALEMEEIVRAGGAAPATIAVLDGRIRIGLQREELERLGTTPGMRKISVRDLGPASTRGESGGTTVAATIFAARRAQIRVMATGGIGGVHRRPPFDISADLEVLARTAIVVVCAGAKAVLDLPATLEYLETMGVPVLGYGTERFPAFYSRDSGLPLEARVDSPGEVAAIGRAHWSLGLESGLLVVVPPPADVALAMGAVEQAIQQALDEAEQQGLRGPAITPFLLNRVSELTGGASLQANLGLLRENARVATKIARVMSEDHKSI